MDLPVDEIVGRVREFGGTHVVLTGGEPMLFAELVPLTHELRRMGHHITIETAGTLDLPVACDLMSISPKFASSAPRADLHAYWHDRHERSRHVPDVVRRLVKDYSYQVKFVIDTPDDLREVTNYLAEFPEISPERVLLMPQGMDMASLEQRAAWLKPYCEERGFRFCPRRHIEWFGCTRGT